MEGDRVDLCTYPYGVGGCGGCVRQDICIEGISWALFIQQYWVGLIIDKQADEVLPSRKHERWAMCNEHHHPKQGVSATSLVHPDSNMINPSSGIPDECSV